MIEIKARVWASNNINPEMIYNVSIQNGLAVDFSDYDISTYSFDPDEVMLYTGLKDKNGKDIYRGDFLGEYYDYDDEDRWDYYEVKFGRTTDARWGFYTEYHGSCMELLCKSEVKGNIYENPELRK